MSTPCPVFNAADCRIAVLGLGYVGLPLAVAFGRSMSTIGFDINPARVDELQSGQDHTLEVSPDELAESRHLTFCKSPNDLVDANIYVATVPTPIDEYKRPNLNALRGVSQMIGQVIKPGDIVIFESTVYPGATEEVCVPEIEHVSGLTYNQDFYVGYSPERMNPGDKEHRLETITKVTSGSTSEAAGFVDALYNQVVDVGTHKASSIAVAEASKVIENTQRDVNIALVNELALIFRRLNLDTTEVLEAAGTKWNFLPFSPGLVGGHCIGVDPYYLTAKAQAHGFHPYIILAGRQVNDNMGRHVAEDVAKHMVQKRIHVKGARVLVLGFTFKENCPDMRNTKVIDIVEELSDYGADVQVFDPWLKGVDMSAYPEVAMIDAPEVGAYDAVILAVAHQQFVEMGAEKIKTFAKTPHVFYDVKALFAKHEVDARL